MREFLRRVRARLRDLALHLGPGLLCVLVGHHRDLKLIGEFSKKGFRGVPAWQCAKCTMFYVRPADARKLGGK